MTDVPARGKVVVNRAVSIDGFIANPEGFLTWGEGRGQASLIPRPDVDEAAARTGAMLVGRRTWAVGDEMEEREPGSVDYPFDGALFLLTHRPLDPPQPGVTILSGDIGAAVATALDAAGGRDLELLGADVAAQAFARGLVDEVLVYVLPVVLGQGVPFSPAGSATVDLEPFESRRSGDITVIRFRVRK